MRSFWGSVEVVGLWIACLGREGGLRKVGELRVGEFVMGAGWGCPVLRGASVLVLRDGLCASWVGWGGGGVGG